MKIDAKTQMEQAAWTAAVYLREAVDIVDHTFGEGTAKRNPMLAVELAKVAAADFTGISLRGIAEALEEDNTGGISMSLDSIANAIEGIA